MKTKTTNALMKYLRNKHNIKISNTKDKRNLINIGYYHGYKGYRYISRPSNKVHFTDFNQIVSIVEFDSKLKSLLYSRLMQIETISKNIVLQILVEKYNTDSFSVIYEKGLTDYKDNNSSKDYKSKMNKRLRLQNNIYSALSKSYNNDNKIVSHFYSQDRPVPIWGIFEIITLGIFADLISCLEKETRLIISEKMGINISYDTGSKLPEKIIYYIKSLRNAVAHNDVIFDVRFKDSHIDSTICNYLENELDCSNIDFSTITDYILLITMLLKKYCLSKTTLNRFVNEYEDIIEDFRNCIPYDIYSQIIYSDTNQKIKKLRKYIKKS